MEELLSTFVRSIFVDNMIFADYLGMCSFLAVSKNVKTALGLGMAVTFILTCTLPINYMLENYVLKEGALQWLGAEFAGVNLSFLAFIIFIATTSCTMIRIRFGIVLRSSEMITLAKATTAVTEIPITIAGSSFDVTASAEQIPNIWTMTGLFTLSGPNRTSLFFSDNNPIFYLIL